MNNLRKHIAFFILCVAAIQSCRTDRSQLTWNDLESIESGIVAPEFLDKEFNILDFGAVGDSLTDCTEAIRHAIDECAINGGGHVVVPAGVFLTGPVHLQSNVDLHIEENGTLRFSSDLSKYLPCVQTRFEGNDLMNYSPLIYARGVENIAITGKGKLDGNADTTSWWPWKGNEKGGWKEGMPNQNADREKLLEMANKGVPVRDRIFGDGHFIRVNFIQFIESKNILIKDVTIVNSPMWEIHPVLCQNITVSGVRVESHGPNNDGCNPESCKDMLIENCYFNTGDDCIAIKSGREEDGRKMNTPSENIIIRDCMMKDGHGGVVIGSEISGGCRNIFIENCEMDSPNLDRALRIKSNSLRGGVIENIFMRNVNVGEVREAVVLIDFYYAEGDIGDFAPVVRNVIVEQVHSEKSRHALWLKGYKRSPVNNILIRNCSFNGVEQGNVLCDVRNLRIRNSYINGHKLKEDPDIGCDGDPLLSNTDQTLNAKQ